MSSAGLQWLMELALELGWTKLHYIALNLNLKKKLARNCKMELLMKKES